MPIPGSSPNGNSLSRRLFLNTLVASTTAVGWCAAQTPNHHSKRYENLKSRKFLGAVQVETRIRNSKVFTEGPAVDRLGHVYFTNVPMEQILKWDPSRKKLTVYREQSHHANGLFFDPHNRLLACEGGAGQVTRTDLKTGKREILANTYHGFPFAAPNDLVLDSRGRLYLTSRPGVTDPKKGNPNAVYRIDPNGEVTQLLRSPEVHMPNGIVISPDNKTLYLIEAHPDADHNRNILAFDLQADGSLANRRVLIDFYPGRSGDGMCIDRQGNLYVAAGLHNRRATSETLDTRPGIHVIAPNGRLVAFAETPEDTITNCSFGGPDGKTLYITCQSYLLSIRTQIAGLRPQAAKS
ncbi:MAG: SMP-30/gluconolactonase/LRE family protein [Planctomycetaceae bacterium]